MVTRAEKIKSIAKSLAKLNVRKQKKILYMIRHIWHFLKPKYPTTSEVNPSIMKQFSKVVEILKHFQILQLYLNFWQGTVYQHGS